MQSCPKCNFAKPAHAESCPKCGVVYAKVARMRHEAAQERKLSDLLEKELGEEAREADDSFEMSLHENRYRADSYSTIQLISGFLNFMAALIVIATMLSAIVTWGLMGEASQSIASLGSAMRGGVFSVSHRLFIVIMQLLGGFTAAALVAAIAGGLHLGRDIAQNTHLAKEYLHRMYVRRGAKRT